MATRALQDLKNALVKRYVITNGTTLAVGDRVIFGANDTTVDKAGANSDLAFGTVVAGGVGNAGGTVFADVVLDSHIIVPMKVGTGGATRGKKQKFATDGVTDADTNGGGTLPHGVVGIAMQTGVVGDLIGVMPANGRYVAAT